MTTTRRTVTPATGPGVHVDVGPGPATHPPTVPEIGAFAALYAVTTTELPPTERLHLTRVANSASAELTEAALQSLSRHVTILAGHPEVTKMQEMIARSRNLVAHAAAYRALSRVLDDEALRIDSFVSAEVRSIYHDVAYGSQKRRIGELSEDYREMRAITGRTNGAHVTARRIAAAAKKAGKAAALLERERQREIAAASRVDEAKKELAHLQATVSAQLDASKSATVKGGVTAPASTNGPPPTSPTPLVPVTGAPTVGSPGPVPSAPTTSPASHA